MNSTIASKLEINTNINQLVVFNTQNQLVNYICARILFELNEKAITKIIAISETNTNESENNPHNKQEKWFQNLNISLKNSKIHKHKLENLKLSSIELDKISNFKDKLSKKLNFDKPILWSITGGQRHLLMQVLALINIEKRYIDVILYYEGNKDQIHKYDYNLFNLKNVNTDIKIVFDFSTLNINLFNSQDESDKILFNLLGFEKVELTCLKKETFNETSDTEKQTKFFYSTINNYFEALDSNYKKRFDFISLYKSLFDKTVDKSIVTTNIKNSFIDIIEEQAPSSKEALIKTLKQEVFYKFNDPNIFDKKATIKITDKTEYIPNFGKFFEKMVYYKVVQIIENATDIKDKILYVALDFGFRDTDISDKQLDQIDVLIFLKTGRLIVIECKVGGAGSDNSKANKFTTYNLSGVYGLPLLVVPHYFKEPTLSICKTKAYEKTILNYKTKFKDSVTDDFYKDSLENVDAIVRQAIRCGLPFTTMNTDNFTTILKHYIS